MTRAAPVAWVPGSRLVPSATSRPAPREGAPVVGVLALQGDVLEHLRALERVGADAVRVRTRADLDAVDAIVLPGGESTTIGRLLERFDLLAPLRQRLAEGLPAYGTCAGLILMSRELAQDRRQPLLGVLDVTTRRNAFGRQVESFECDLDVVGVDGPPVKAVFIRAPWIERVGDGVEVLAMVDGRAVLVSQGELLAGSFHPELSGDDRLHALFVARVEAARARRGRGGEAVAAAG